MKNPSAANPQDRVLAGRSPQALPSRRLDVQGLRAVAVVLVVLYHAGVPVPGGFAGVDVFFVISGFVIGRLLLRELQAEGRVSLRRFYVRRFRRLLPALAVLLVVVVIASLFLLSPLGYQQQVSKTALGTSLFSANAVLFMTSGGYFNISAEGNPLLHMWSLSVEEQFYFFLPLFLGFVWWVAVKRQKDRVRLLMFGVLAVGAVSLAGSVWLTYAHGLPFGGIDLNRSFAFFASPARAWEFLAGVVIAIGERRLSQSLSVRVGWGLALVGATGLVVTAFVLNGTTAFPGYIAALPVLSTSMLLVAGIRGGNPVTRLLSCKPAVRIGDLSYSFYLWHWPFIVFYLALNPHAGWGSTVVVALASLVPSALSYRYVENRFRRATPVPQGKPWKFAVGVLVVPVAAAICLQVSTGFVGAPMKSLRDDHVLHADVNCQKNFPLDARTKDLCTWGPPDGSGGTVLLLGDSNAGHFAEPVRIAAEQSGRRMVLATFGLCSVADAKIEFPRAYPTDSCVEFMESWSDWIATEKPDLVVVAGFTTSYVNSEGVRITDPSGVVHEDERGRTAALGEALARRMATWADSGVPALLVHQVPSFDDFDLAACPAVVVYSGVERCSTAMSPDLARARLANSRAAEDIAVRSVPSARSLDLFEEICDSAACSAHSGSGFKYRDGGHLSVPFASSLAPLFAEEFLKMSSVRGGDD